MAGDAVVRGKALVVDGAADPDSELRRGVERLVVRAGEVLRDDPQIAARESTRCCSALPARRVRTTATTWPP